MKPHGRGKIPTPVSYTHLIPKEYPLQITVNENKEICIVLDAVDLEAARILDEKNRAAVAGNETYEAVSYTHLVPHLFLFCEKYRLCFKKYMLILIVINV